MIPELESFVLSSLPRSGACRSPSRSMKVIVSEIGIYSDVKFGLEPGAMGHSIPKSSEELLSRVRTMCGLSQKHKANLDFHDDPGWMVAGVHFYEGNVLHIKFRIFGELIKEVGSALRPNGEVCSIQFPDRQSHPCTNGFHSHMVGWRNGVLFGSFSTDLLTRKFWVLDFESLLLPKTGIPPLTISQPHNLLVFTKRENGDITDRPSEIHFMSSISAFLCVGKSSNKSWCLSLVRYNSIAAEFLFTMDVQLSRDHFGPPWANRQSIQSHPEFWMESDLKSVIISNWCYSKGQAPLEVFLVHSQVDFGLGTAEIVDRLTERQQVDWEYNPLSDRTYSRVIPCIRYKLILVEANQIVGAGSARIALQRCTWLYRFEQGRFSIMAVKHQSLARLPVRGATQLRFAEELGLQTYWVSRIPHTHRILILRESYMLD